MDFRNSFQNVLLAAILVCCLIIAYFQIRLSDEQLMTKKLLENKPQKESYLPVIQSDKTTASMQAILQEQKSAAFNKAQECLNSGEIDESFLYFQNAITNNPEEWEIIKKYFQLVSQNASFSEMPIEKRGLFMNELKDLIQTKYQNIPYDRLPEWQNAMVEIEKKVGEMSIPDSLVSDTEAAKILVERVIGNDCESVNDLEQAMKTIVEKTPALSKELELKTRIQKWFEKNTTRVQQNNLIAEMKEQLSQFEKNPEQMVYLGMAQGNLQQIAGLNLKWIKAGNPSVNIQELELQIEQTKTKRDKALIEKSFSTAKKELLATLSKKELSVEDKIKALESTLKKANLVFSRLLSEEAGQSFLKDMEELKRLLDEHIFRSIKAQVDGVLSKNYSSHRFKIEAIQNFLSQPGDLASKITDEKKRDEFSKEIESLKKEMVDEIRSQNKAYQKWALEKINTAYKNCQTIGATTWDKESAGKKILLEDLKTIDPNQLSLEVRKVYEEIFSDAYQYLGKQAKLDVTTQFLEASKCQISDW